jgi:hypothetical protein
MNLGLIRRAYASSASRAIDFELDGRVRFKVDALNFLYFVTKRLYGTSNLLVCMVLFLRGKGDGIAT